MSKFASGVFGTVALAVTLGVAQLAVGSDLGGNPAAVAGAAQTNLVNRAAKTDRQASIAVAGGPTVTQLSALGDTSVVIRVPRQVSQQEGKLMDKISPRPVACEASASVLTAIAKHMESGRCIT
jgi:hypothetical protein